MSLDGSNSTTLASSGPRAVSTETLVVPATTCALVITRSGAMTKPEPSSARWQLGATPRMRSTLCCNEAATGLASTLGSGELVGYLAQPVRGDLVDIGQHAGAVDRRGDGRL
ncbi:Uncharacterised protein [Mycobacteroides abscessus subsp. abscessus]|nr:Uncharacterised protein [Mycobacteroides abscessus subsp. abscessus]